MKYLQCYPYSSYRICTNLFIWIICFFMPCVTIARAEAETPKASFITSFPFTMLDGGTILLRAAIGNAPDTLNFVLDTGSGGISLDSSTAEQLKLTTVNSDKNIIGIAQKKKGNFILNQTLRLPNLTVDSLDFHVNDYEFLSISKGIKIDGIIGYSFLSRFIVKVNYDELKIEVWKPGFMKYPKAGFNMPLYIDNLPMFDANVKDNKSVRGRYFFDTGADVCFIMSQKFVEDSAFLKTNKKALAVPAEGLGGSRAMKFITVDQLHVGPYVFRKVPSFIFDDTYNVTRYPQLGGLIGNDLLHRFNLIINYRDAEIHLSPNSHFNDPFDYVYTGFKIFRVNGKAVIDQVVKDSPAEKAGLQNGDLLVGVNNNFSNNLDGYKNIISSARDELKMTVLRNNQFKTIVVSVERVL
jgi:predicted aspartyl protease